MTQDDKGQPQQGGQSNNPGQQTQQQPGQKPEQPNPKAGEKPAERTGKN